MRLGYYDRFRFGKYAGMMVGNVVRFDPSYIRWFHRNVHRDYFTNYVLRRAHW